MQPEGVLSGWLPVATPWSGTGWGMICPPTPGQQVIVIAQEGASEHGIIVGTTFSQAMLPPNVPVGECWLIHGSGSALKLTNQGDVVIAGSQININGNVNITGNLAVSGTVSDATGQIGILGR